MEGELLKYSLIAAATNAGRIYIINYLPSPQPQLYSCTSKVALETFSVFVWPNHQSKNGFYALRNGLAKGIAFQNNQLYQLLDWVFSY